ILRRALSKLMISVNNRKAPGLGPFGQFADHHIEFRRQMMENRITPDDVERILAKEDSFKLRAAKPNRTLHAIEFSSLPRQINYFWRNIDPSHECAHLSEHHCIRAVPTAHIEQGFSPETAHQEEAEFLVE